MLYCSLYKTTLKKGGLYTKSPKWLRNKGATINPKIEDTKCLRDAPTTALNHEKIKHNSERISNFMPFFDQFNWEGIKFPSH